MSNDIIHLTSDDDGFPTINYEISDDDVIAVDDDDGDSNIQNNRGTTSMDTYPISVHSTPGNASGDDVIVVSPASASISPVRLTSVLDDDVDDITNYTIAPNLDIRQDNMNDGGINSRADEPLEAALDSFSLPPQSMNAFLEPHFSSGRGGLPIAALCNPFNDGCNEPIPLDVDHSPWYGDGIPSSNSPSVSDEPIFVSVTGGAPTIVDSNEAAESPIDLDVVAVDDDQKSDPTFESAKDTNDTKSSGVTNRFARELVQLSTNSSDATTEAKTPPELSVCLLRHQRQALAWMERCEDIKEKPPGHPRGGILADDQGFGKTLSLIALMLKNRPQPKPTTDGTPPTPAAWGNLVVAPATILRQWACELEDRIDALHRPKVLIYHGSNRPRNPYELVGYDVVITSYRVLVQEYPKEVKATKQQRSPGPLYKVEWHRIILDEAQAIKNRHSDAHRATAELRAKFRWAATGTPIQNSIDDIYSLFLFLRYHVVGSYAEWRTRFKSPLEGQSTAARRERVFKQFQAILGPVLLRRAKHDRIEGKPVIPLPARNIRTLELDLTKTEREYYDGQELRAVYRIHALGEEMNSPSGMTTALVILLRLRQACNHPKLCEWDSPTQFSFSDDELDAIDIRMQVCSLYRSLPPSVQTRLFNELAPESNTPQTCPICMDIITVDGTVTKCGHIYCSADFDSWIRNNDTCPSCRTQLGGASSFMKLDAIRKEVHALVRKQKREGEKQEVPADSNDDSPVKQENEIAMRLLGKRPMDEDTDVEDEEQQSPQKRKPKQKKAKKRKISTKKVEPMQNGKAEDADETKGQQIETSTKIKAFIKEFDNIAKNTDDKVLCFSQWTRMLDLVQEQVVASGHEVVRLDGNQSLDERAEAVRMFQTRRKCRLFLISLKAGSTGLNLTAANRVYLLDSWWNPAVEDQAIDRVHRIGQLKDVEVVKLKIRRSVEERIFELQEKKRSTADGVLGKEGLKMLGRKRLTMEEVLGLFQDVYEHVARRAEERQDTQVTNIVQGLVESRNSVQGDRNF